MLLWIRVERLFATFVSECLDYRRFEAPDLHLYVITETLQWLGGWWFTSTLVVGATSSPY